VVTLGGVGEQVRVALDTRGETSYTMGDNLRQIRERLLVAGVGVRIGRGDLVLVGQRARGRRERRV
jgi:hypothetical protein